MKRLHYALIVSDFDGTLVRDDGNIDEANKIAIKEYTENGGIFAISTGRMPYGILPRAKELGLKGILCACQGAVIMDIESGEALLEGTIPCEITVDICEKMEALGLHIHVYDQTDYYCNMDDDALKLYQKAVRTTPILVTDKPMSVYVKEKGICAYKVLAMVNPKDNVRIMQALEKENFAGCCVTKSADFLVEVINASYSKGTAVEFLAERYGVPIEKTIGVGDQQNDIPMIKAAGLGIAVKNADEALKKEAVVLEYTNEEAAIAKIIEKYGYTEDKI